jgi:ribosomal protein S17
MEQDKKIKAKKFLEGTVMSDKMDKTAVVAVNTFKSHRNI